MSDKKGRQQEDSLKRAATTTQASADTAIANATPADPLRQRLMDRIGKILDWRDDKGAPKDVRDFPDQAAMSIYTDAKRVSDEGRVGRGYGTLSDGGSDTYAAALGKELESERGLEASGRLEGFVNDSLNAADAGAVSMGGQEEDRRMALAGMFNSNAQAANDRYTSYLARPKQPGFLKSLALGAVGNLSFAKGGLTV